ncbi:MAG: hypothetical protein RBU27_00655 [Bacteroidota bacterium]|jgi:tetratricopeptide (TPR) repeat protein|nr:hypothetical protein [Bacteroidota bacterium]
MNTPIPLLVAVVFLVACNTEKPAADATATPQPSATAQSAAPRDVSTATLVAIDEDIQPYADAVDAAREAYEAEASDAAKAALVKAYVDFGDYMQYDSSVSPRQGKYHRALLEYRHALDLEPGNANVLGEIAQIEEIYRGMGRPIPGGE